MFATRSWFALELNNLLTSGSGSMWVVRVVMRTVDGVLDVFCCVVEAVTE